MDYVHQPLSTEVTAIGGYYRLVKESRLDHGGRVLLYLIAHAAFETTCCGIGGCAYAIVAGYVISWKYGTNPEDLPVSRIEPVAVKSDQEEIRQKLLGSEPIQQVIFL